MRPPQTEFVAFTTKGKENYGELLVHKMDYFHRPDGYEGPYLAIDLIKTQTKNQGLGKEMIEFAKNYSKTIGCKGNIILKAVADFTPERLPHLFYRKQGFSTYNKKNDKQMDKLLKANIPATMHDFPVMIMFYPQEERTSWFEKLWNKFIKNPLGH